jgi:hypothetical protein
MLLMPGGTGRNQSATRASLLARRTEWLVTGLKEEDMPEGMVRHMHRTYRWSGSGC